jgi:hypothetical protein
MMLSGPFDAVDLVGMQTWYMNRAFAVPCCRNPWPISHSHESVLSAGSLEIEREAENHRHSMFMANGMSQELL